MATSVDGCFVVRFPLYQVKEGRGRADRAVKENVRAKMRVTVRRILRKHGYPPDKQDKATQTVLEHAGLMAEGLAAWSMCADENPNSNVLKIHR